MYQGKLSLEHLQHRQKPSLELPAPQQNMLESELPSVFHPKVLRRCFRELLDVLLSLCLLVAQLCCALTVKGKTTLWCLNLPIMLRHTTKSHQSGVLEHLIFWSVLVCPCSTTLCHKGKTISGNDADRHSGWRFATHRERWPWQIRVAVGAVCGVWWWC